MVQGRDSKYYYINFDVLVIKATRNMDAYYYCLEFYIQTSCVKARCGLHDKNNKQGCVLLLKLKWISQGVFS